MVRLADRSPEVDAHALVQGLVPPPLFDRVSFDTYRPDPGEPSQSAALAALRAFAERLASNPPEPKWWRTLRGTPAPPEGRPGVYLDGGFGVGKTHLLASLWHVAPSPKAFATFVELTHVVGALGFNEAAERLSGYRLVCIDEFELDDPGDTVLMSSLFARLTEHGVNLAATANTLPDRLGEGRYAVDEFLREIQGLAAQFDVLRIDGDDYRHRMVRVAPRPATEGELAAATAAASATLDDFGGLLAKLESVHPSRYGALVSGVDTVGLRGVRVVNDHAVALRLVVFIDRLYDRQVAVVASGAPINHLFAAELLHSGYRKKYFRALSRLLTLVSDDG